MRPVQKPMNFGYLRPYPPEVAKHTGLSFHWGQDFLAEQGTPVSAGVDGWWLGCSEHRGYGWLAEVLFFTGKLFWKQWYIARYAHLSPISKQPYNYGQKITKNSVVGISGGSGTFYADNSSTKPRFHYHLHIECFEAKKVKGTWVRTKLVDPVIITGISKEEV